MAADVAFKGLEAFHGILGVLWIIMLIWFVLSISKYRSSQTDTAGKIVRKSGNAQRILGGLAIIMGLILVATMKTLGSNFNFDSYAGIFLSIGIVFAIIAYVIFGEGMAMRLARNLNADKSKSLMTFALLELLFAILTIIFMFVGTSV